MSKLTYIEQLLTPEWKSRRLAILKRDKRECTKCKSKKRLHVHHKWYKSDLMAWEYPDDCLITLCSVCHKKAHGIKSKKSSSRKERNGKVITKLKSHLSKKDKELQKRYDKIIKN